MKDVSCRALDVFFSNVKKKGAQPAALANGTGYDLAHLRSRKERIEWSAFVQFAKNCSSIWSPQELEDLGGEVFRSPIIKPLNLVSRLLFTPIGVYKSMQDARGVGKQLFACVEAVVAEESPGVISLKLQLLEGREACEEFFWVTKGSFKNLPRLFGQPPATVIMNCDGRRADYRVVLNAVRRPSLLSRIRKTFSFVDVATELKKANEDLVEQYKTIQLQARRLDVAQTISLLAQQDLDLDATLKAVADALISKGGFLGARLAIDAVVGGVHVIRDVSSGELVSDESPLPLDARGHHVGTLAVKLPTGDAMNEAVQLLGIVQPAIAMAIDEAVTFEAVRAEEPRTIQPLTPDRAEEPRTIQPLTPERWQRLKELFQAALDQDRAARVAFLSRAAPDDPALAEEVLRLLASEEKAGTFLSAPATAAEALPGGRRIGSYRLLGEMGHGGMGAVYRAIRDDDQYQKQVAIKLVRGGTGPAFILERFKAERQILAGLEHPNIARLIDGGTTEEGWPWFAMEFVEGEPIDAWCTSRNVATAGRLELFRTVCSAVQYAHQRLVIHRDLKPANILVTADGVPKLLDFGIAKLLRTDQAPGAITALPLMTPEYASPEQVKGEPVTTASDVYSLGVLLYELLARRRPYEIKTRSPEEVARVVCQVEPRRPSALAPPAVARQLAGDLDAIALQALRKEPQRRYASAQKLSEDLGRHLAGLPVLARGDRLTYLAGKFARRHKTAAAAAALVVLSLVGAILATARQARIADRAPSIAVLPFVDLSANKDQEYFSDGIAEEILNLLAKVPGLHVAARTSAFSFKGKNEDVRAIGQKLNVAYVLEGSVRKESNRVRVNAQLVGAADGYHVWSKTFDRESTGVFAVQDEISRAVVEALKVRLVTGQRPRRTASPEVYNEYLLGKQFLHRQTLADHRRAVAAYERALAIDPGFAPAWAGLALATTWIAEIAETSAAISQGYQRAMAAAEKSVALDPELADGYAVRGFLRSYVQWDWEGARADCERALALNPGDSDNHYRYAWAVLRPLGRLPEAIGETRKATDLDPLSPLAWRGLGELYLATGQLGPAQAALERSLRILPEQHMAPFFLAVTLLLQKKPPEALAAAEQSTLELLRMLGKALALNDLGRTGEAHRLVEQVIQRHGHSAAFQIAESYASFGERDRAFEWLERAYAQRDPGLAIFLHADPLLRSLRGDPRFAALLRKMNLPAD